jgi:HEAT repeat protein
MGFLKGLFSAQDGPSERQIRRAVRQVTQIHGEAGTRVAAMERLASWRTAEAAAGLLRRFTVQTLQASMDLDEKQYTVRLLAQMGRVAVNPILQYISTQPDVTFPVQAMKEITPPDEFYKILIDTLDKLSQSYTRWPEAKTVLLEYLDDAAFPQALETVLRLLEDDDDDVCIAAIDCLVRIENEEIRVKLLETFFESESRPRVRGRILDQFCEREWPVKGYRKKMEEAIAPPYYLTSKGTVKRKQE